ncbi:MAG TPA: hypothetical protein PKM34_10670 [Bacteroidales bacterium]|nr:hypothetical protein [Bacteroidales bacterium]
MPSHKIINIRPAILISCLAVLMFSPMFVLRQVGPIDFWWWMTINLSILISLSIITDWEYYYILSKDFTKLYR